MDGDGGSVDWRKHLAVQEGCTPCDYNFDEIKRWMVKDEVGLYYCFRVLRKINTVILHLLRK